MKWASAMLVAGCFCTAISQEPWIYVDKQNTWVLYRPKKLSSTHVQDLRIGQVRMQVEDTKLGDVPCKLYTWHSEIWPHAGGPDAQVDYDTQTWVDPSGKVVKIVATTQKWTTVYRATAILKNDEVEITHEGPQGKRTSILYPAEGTKLFDQGFMGLLKNKEAKPEDTTAYYELDAVKGLPVRYSARVKNRFSATYNEETVKGLSMEITGPSGKIIAYVSEKGELVQVDYPNGTRIFPFRFTPTIRQLSGP